jgi:hypothetical protein
VFISVFAVVRQTAAGAAHLPTTRVDEEQGVVVTSDTSAAAGSAPHRPKSETGMDSASKEDFQSRL